MTLSPLSALFARLRRLARCDAGGIAMFVGLAAVPLIGSVGLAVDASVWYGERAKLQSTADTAALAAAREMRLLNTPARQLESATRASTLAELEARGEDMSRAAVSAEVDSELHSVRVVITVPLERVFSRVVTDAFASVSVAATARVSGSAPICVIGLDPSDAKTIHLEKRATLDAGGCAVYSNSNHQQGLRIDNFASISAALICSGGGRTGPHSAFRPTPRTDCPPVPDPLASRAPPEVGACTHRDLEIERDRFLTPGVYCGGIKIDDGARVTLGSGVYIIKDGDLEVDDGTLTGRYVSFYFTGDDSEIAFKEKSTIDLTAMRDGALAGLLFFQDPTAQLGRDFKIESDDARNLLGTIYLPRGDLYIGSRNAVADRSAFTVIVARKLELTEGPVLTLNTDYHLTDIPVPAGLGPTGDVHLTQ